MSTDKKDYIVLHKRSKVVGKQPTSNDIQIGEIAINYAKDNEFLSIINEIGDTVVFSSDKYFTETKLGSGFTGENSGITVTDYAYTKDETDDKDLIVCSALNDLEERKANKSEISNLNAYRDFHVGSNRVNSLNNVPVSKRLVIANGITTSNNTLTLDGVLNEGYEMYIIVQGISGTEVILDSTMINTSGESITINENGYCEISIISANNGETYYVRGV